MLRALLAATLVAMLLPAAARAVTIQEFPIEPGSQPGAQQPYYLEAGPDGALWIVNRGTSSGIQRVTTSGQRLAPIPTPTAPQDIAVGASGAVFWTESAIGNDTLEGRLALRLPDGTITRTEPRGNPYAVGLSADEDVWVGDQVVEPGSAIDGIGRVCVLADDFTLPCRQDPAGSITRYTSVVVAPGNVGWVAGFELNVVKRYRLGATGNVPNSDLTVPLPAGSGPGRMALGPDGNLWVTMFSANRIDRITPDGERREFPLPPGAKGPNDITVGPDGALWFTEFLGNGIGRITTSGQITEFAAPTPGSAPYGITTGPDGALWFTQNATGTIARLVLDRPGTAGGPAGGGGGISDRVAPVFEDALGVTRSSFRAGTTSRRGTTFEFSLSEPARVAITIARKRSGRRVDGRCVAPTRRNRRRSRCDRYAEVGTVRVDGRQGANAVRFSGRLNGRNLSPGTYRASAVATDAAGNASRASRVAFTVRRR